MLENKAQSHSCLTVTETLLTTTKLTLLWLAELMSNLQNIVTILKAKIYRKLFNVIILTEHLLMMIAKFTLFSLRLKLVTVLS